MAEEPGSRQRLCSTTDDSAVHDAILALTLHRYAIDRGQTREPLRLHTVVHIAALARHRGLMPISDVLLLGFELDSTAVQPLDPDVVEALEMRVQEAEATRHLDWLCGLLIGTGPDDVGELAKTACRALSPGDNQRQRKSNGSNPDK